MELVFYACVVYVLFSLFTEVKYRGVYKSAHWHWSRYPYWWNRVYYRYPFRSRGILIAAIIFGILYKIQAERSIWDKIYDLF